MSTSGIRWAWLLLIGWIVIVGPGAIDGRLFPAAAPMELTRAKLVDKGTAIWGKSSRLRPECSFERIRWYMGSRYGKRVPAAVDTGPPIVRDDGDFEFGPWVVDIWPPAVVEIYSFADVYHRCQVFGFDMPWLTKTRFWN